MMPMIPIPLWLVIFGAFPTALFALFLAFGIVVLAVRIATAIVELIKESLQTRKLKKMAEREIDPHDYDN